LLAVFFAGAVASLEASASPPSTALAGSAVTAGAAAGAEAFAVARRGARFRAGARVPAAWPASAVAPAPEPRSEPASELVGEVNRSSGEAICGVLPAPTGRGPHPGRPGGTAPISHVVRGVTSCRRRGAADTEVGG